MILKNHGSKYENDQIDNWYPKFNPDGRYLVFTRTYYENITTAILRISDKHLLEIDYNDYAWSPNGKFIVTGGNPPVGDLGGKPGLFITSPVDNRIEKNILNIAPDEMKEYKRPYWSKDNKIYFLYAKGSYINDDPNRGGKWNNQELWEVSPRGRKLKKLGNLNLRIEEDQEVHWSPDGKKLAFLKKGRNDIWILSLKDFSIKNITNKHQKIEGFCWSPDGKRIVYCYPKSIHFINVH